MSARTHLGFGTSVVAVLAACLGVALPAHGAAVPVFYGYATGLQFTCDGVGRERTQKASVHMDTGGSASLATVPTNPQRAYAIDADLLAPLVPGRPSVVGGRFALSIN